MTEVSYIVPLAVVGDTEDISWPQNVQAFVRIPPHSSPLQVIRVPSEMSGPFQDSATSKYLRVGGPNLCEIPYNCRRLPREHIPFGDVRSILHNHNIRFLTTFFVECTPGYDDLAEPIQTLQILARGQESDSPDSWQYAVQEIHALLRSHGLDDITVDIIDWRLVEGPMIYPCKSNDDIFPKWDMVRNRILQVVDVSGFQLLGCYRMGYDPGVENSTPSVLVTVDPKHQRDWSIVEHDIRNILTVLDLRMVDVRIFKDRGIFCGSRSCVERQNISSVPTVEEEFPRSATIGDAVGAHNSNSYGTFGGWLEIQQDPHSEWQQFGLTCRHCVFDHAFTDLKIYETKDEAAEHVRDKTDKLNNRTPNITEAPQQRNVDCPSLSRVQYLIDYYKDRIDKKRNKESFRNLEEIRREGSLPEDLAKKWARHMETLSDLENHLAELEAYKRTNGYEFGWIWVDSGDDPQSTTKIMDWALLKPHPNRAFPFNDFAVFRGLGDRQPKARMGKIEAGTVLSVEQEIFKRGFGTGVTRGKYSALAVAVFTVAKSGERRITDEYSVVYNIHDDCFVPGDSGSILFDEQGLIAGMAFGGQICGKIVIFTHIDDLIADIKRQTGAENVIFYGQLGP